MASYEDVVAKYGDTEYCLPVESTAVYAHAALDPDASITYKTHDVLRGVGAVIQGAGDIYALERALAPVRKSPLLFEQIAWLAGSELAPAEMAAIPSLTPYGIVEARIKVRRLFVARSIYETITGQPLQKPEPVQDTLPARTSPSSAGTSLGRLAEHAAAAAVTGHRSTRRARAEQEVWLKGYDEARLSRIALSELEPAWVIDRLERKEGMSPAVYSRERQIVQSAASILVATRSIARTMCHLA